MAYLRLVHSDETEAREKASRLEAAGYEVVWRPLAPADLRAMKKDPPLALVVDLSRAPAFGRDVALALREAKATRHVPIVFVEGQPEKIARVQETVPDAVYTTWRRIRGSLKQAIAHPPASPSVPASRLAGYSGTPLPKKLGIKPDAVVGLLGAPPDFEATLGSLPEGVTLRRPARGRCDLLLWFTKSRKDLESRIEKMAERVGRDGLWICWPKKASGVVTDLTQNDVRQRGLASGLVDYKIAAIDATWSGLKFARRKPR